MRITHRISQWPAKNASTASDSCTAAMESSLAIVCRFRHRTLNRVAKTDTTMMYFTPNSQRIE